MVGRIFSVLCLYLLVWLYESLAQSHHYILLHETSLTNLELAFWWLFRTVSTYQLSLEQHYQSGLASYGRFVVGSVTSTRARRGVGSHCNEGEGKLRGFKDFDYGLCVPN